MNIPSLMTFLLIGMMFTFQYSGVGNASGDGGVVMMMMMMMS